MKSQEQEVRDVLDSLRPAMETDGGGVNLISIENGRVALSFKGACTLCPSISLTQKAITNILKAELDWVVEVVRIDSLT